MKYSKYEVYYIYDEPVGYKKLKLYPVKIRKYLYFQYLVEAITRDKNSIPDVKIISMPYLDYLFYTNEEGKNDNIGKLDGLLRICLGKEDDLEFTIRYAFDEKNKAYFEIDGEQYYGQDFDEIKQIICEQNLVELPDEKIQKEIREKMEEAKRIRAKANGIKMASFEDQMVALMIATSLSLEDVYNLTVRKFNKAIQRLDAKLHYEIYLAASMSGMVEFKDKSFIKHWLSELDNDPNRELLDAEKLTKKVSSGDANN